MPLPRTCLAAAGAVTARGRLSTSPFAVNELDRVRTGGNTARFVELFDGGLVPVTLSEHTLVFFDGDAPNFAAPPAVLPMPEPSPLPLAGLALAASGKTDRAGAD